jgi:hypothetical protein
MEAAGLRFMQCVKEYSKINNVYDQDTREQLSIFSVIKDYNLPKMEK